GEFKGAGDWGPRAGKGEGGSGRGGEGGIKAVESDRLSPPLPLTPSPTPQWSQKRLHRLILLSTAYRQSSALDPARAATDPDNVLLGAWRPHRHEGEVVRDSLLALAGKLNLEMFGPPVPVVRQADGQVVTN